MYKVLKIKWISALFLLPLAAGAQGIDEVLQSVGQHNKVLQAIQVSYDIQNEKTRKREIAGLLRVAQKTGCRHLLLLTDHDHEDLHHDTLPIAIRPVHEWLLIPATNPPF